MPDKSQAYSGEMIIISAMSNDRIIGCGAGMPWNVPDEYKQYLDFVSGNTVILGRKSYEIFGADLPDGTSVIVISRSADFDGVIVVPSLAAALAQAETEGKTVFVAGGGSVYAQAIPFAEEMYLSTIKGDFKGDTYFPEFEASEWVITEERDEPEFVFRIYRRIGEATGNDN